MGRQKDVLATIEEHLRIRNKLVRQALAECLGTLILVVSLCWGEADTILVGGHCPGKGAVLLLGFVPWMSPAPVQPTPWALEEKILSIEQGKAHASCCRVSFRVAGKGWALQCSAGAGGLCCACGVQGAEKAPCESRNFPGDRAKLPFPLGPGIFSWH